MHAVAHAEVEGILSAARSELVNIQHVQADLNLEPPVEDKEGPNELAMPMPAAWSEGDSHEPCENTLGWETEDDDEGISELTFSNHSSCLPMNGQLESVGEIIVGFEQRNIVFRDVKLPTPEEHSRPLSISVDINNCPLPKVLVDIGASKSVYSLSTLDHLGIEKNKVTKHRFA